jgi:hypothetical protein
VIDLATALIVFKRNRKSRYMNEYESEEKKQNPELFNTREAIANDACLAEHTNPMYE